MDRAKPQAFLSSYAPRLRAYNNSLLTPVAPTAVPVAPLSRTTKRGTTVINYAEDGYDEIEYDSEDRRRPTGLRSLRKEDSTARIDIGDKAAKDTKEPVEVQGIWRDWIGKNRYFRSDQQNAAQANLPLTLIPIRIDLDVPAYTPAAAFPPPPPNMPQSDMSAPQYRPSETTLPYKLRDIFCWNLHETLITTDQFATTMASELDLPNRHIVVAEISKQIRTQLEEYSGVALHPLFHSETMAPVQPQTANKPNGVAKEPEAKHQAVLATREGSPSSLAKGTPRPDTPGQTGQATPSQAPETPGPKVTAEATPILPDSDDFNPDDT